MVRAGYIAKESLSMPCFTSLKLGVSPPVKERNHGKIRVHRQRESINAVFYIIKTGCQWRFLPKDFPPWESVYSFYWRDKRKGRWEKMMRDLGGEQSP